MKTKSTSFQKASATKISKKAVEQNLNKHFDHSLTERERAVFEGGIALGALHQQFMGIPILKDADLLAAIEKVIEKSTTLRPFKIRARVRIQSQTLKSRKSPAYDYSTLKGENVVVRVECQYRKARAIVGMKHIDELDYDLMFVEKIQ